MTNDDQPAGTPYKRFIVLSGPRTGSTLLSDALNSSPDIVCFGEIFNMHLEGVDYRVDGYDTANAEDVALRLSSPAEFLSNRIYCGYPDNIRAVGFKFHYDHFWGFSGLRQALEEDEDIAVIHLQRRNQLRVLVSGKIAEQTGAYLQRANPRTRITATIARSLRRMVFSRAQPSRVQVNVGVEEFKQFGLVKAMTADHWGEIFSKHQTLPVAYEEMTSDLQKEFARVQSFLGVAPAALQVRLTRQNPQKLEELIENYAELRSAFVGTPAEWMFAD